MKNIIIIAIIIFSFMSCKAQQPIFPLYEGSEYGNTSNAYYKDTFNDFDKFIGTWRYFGEGKVFEVVFAKKSAYLMNITYPSSIDFFTDILIGEYKYSSENGNEIVNTLSQISNNNLDVFHHMINGNSFVGPKYPPICESCQTNERRVLLSFEDPGRDYLNYKIIIRYVLTPFLDSNGNQIETIELQLTNETSIIPLGESAESRIPYGKYTLIKQ